MPYDDNGEEIAPGPTEAEMEAFLQKELAQELALLVEWAEERAESAGLYDEIRTLTKEKIGTLTGAQAQYLNALETMIPFGVTPTVFVQVRTILLLIPPEELRKIDAPSVRDAEETKMRRWALQDIRDWLVSSPARQHRYPHLLAKYEEAIRTATETYTGLYGPLMLNKVIRYVMTLPEARRLIKEAQKGE
jgi:hypothetical protein